MEDEEKETEHADIKSRDPPWQLGEKQKCGLNFQNRNVAIKLGNSTSKNRDIATWDHTWLAWPRQPHFLTGTSSVNGCEQTYLKPC